MSGKDNKEKEGNEKDKSAWEKFTAEFREEGKGGVLEQIMNYAVDVFTVTAGAGSLTAIAVFFLTGVALQQGNVLLYRLECYCFRLAMPGIELRLFNFSPQYVSCCVVNERVCHKFRGWGLGCMGMCNWQTNQVKLEMIGLSGGGVQPSPCVSS